VADAAGFHLSVITPERAVLETEATFVAFPAWDGEVGILRNRAPLLTKLGVGELRAATRDGERRLYVEGGFAQMVENRLTILTEQAREAAEIDAAEAARARAEAEAIAGTDEVAVAARERALVRARVKERLAARRQG
jgi:F-type H+-transporting ATPase subunit epsilon